MDHPAPPAGSLPKRNAVNSRILEKQSLPQRSANKTVSGYTQLNSTFKPDVKTVLLRRRWNVLGSEPEAPPPPCHVTGTHVKHSVLPDPLQHMVLPGPLPSDPGSPHNGASGQRVLPVLTRHAPETLSAACLIQMWSLSYQRAREDKWHRLCRRRHLLTETSQFLKPALTTVCLCF